MINGNVKFTIKDVNGNIKKEWNESNKTFDVISPRIKTRISSYPINIFRNNPGGSHPVPLTPENTNIYSQLNLYEKESDLLNCVKQQVPIYIGNSSTSPASGCLGQLTKNEQTRKKITKAWTFNITQENLIIKSIGLSSDTQSSKNCLYTYLFGNFPYSYRGTVNCYVLINNNNYYMDGSIYRPSYSGSSFLLNKDLVKFKDLNTSSIYYNYITPDMSKIYCFVKDGVHVYDATNNYAEITNTPYLETLKDGYTKTNTPSVIINKNDLYVMNYFTSTSPYKCILHKLNTSNNTFEPEDIEFTLDLDKSSFKKEESIYRSYPLTQINSAIPFLFDNKSDSDNYEHYWRREYLFDFETKTITKSINSSSNYINCYLFNCNFADHWDKLILKQSSSDVYDYHKHDPNKFFNSTLLNLQSPINAVKGDQLTIEYTITIQ